MNVLFLHNWLQSNKTFLKIKTIGWFSFKMKEKTLDRLYIETLFTQKKSRTHNCLHARDWSSYFCSEFLFFESYPINIGVPGVVDNAIAQGKVPHLGANPLSGYRLEFVAKSGEFFPVGAVAKSA